MSSDNALPRQNAEELKQVEQTLASLTPRPPHVDRDRLMFLAGAASAGARGQGTGDRGQEMHVERRRGARAWPAATAALAATSLALAIALVVRISAPPQVVYVERPAQHEPKASPSVIAQSNPTHEPVAAPNVVVVPRRALRTVAAPQVPADNYLRTREVALRMGLDALGTTRSAGGESPGESSHPMTYIDWLAGFGSEASPPASDAPGNSPLPQM